MAVLVACMAAEVGAPLAPVLFASDAQGSNDDDFGGWGVVARNISPSEAATVFQMGARPGRSVVKLSGDFAGLRRPEESVPRNIPFSQLPRSIIEADDWVILDHDRWRFEDHVTLGECRAMNKVVEVVASEGTCHGHRICSLQDNAAAAGAFRKGRSPGPAVNYLLRRRCALSLAARLQFMLPWTQTDIMPADEVSRLQTPLRPPPTGSSSVGEGQGQHR